MTAALLVLAAETGPSKTPFYVLGGLLVAWAILVALIGLRRPEFPSTAGAARGLYAITGVLVLAAAGSAILTS